jgi:hypothetical protein
MESCIFFCPLRLIALRSQAELNLPYFTRGLLTLKSFSCILCPYFEGLTTLSFVQGRGRPRVASSVLFKSPSKLKAR